MTASEHAPKLFDAPVEEKLPTISTMPLEVAQHALWHFGDRNLGVQPGTFTERLFLTISAADVSNRDRLALSFPDQVKAFRAVSNEHWGLEWLRNIARGVVPTDPAAGE